MEKQTKLAITFAILLLLFGCTDQNKSYGTAKLQLPDGAIIECEVPLTPQGIEMGLMYRDGICETCGMLFIFPNDARHQFWMKNMRFNIDIIFINRDWRVVDIAQDVEPCSKTPCPVYIPNANSRYVLELEANATIKHGIFIGSEIKKIE